MSGDRLKPVLDLPEGFGYVNFGGASAMTVPELQFRDDGLDCVKVLDLDDGAGFRDAVAKLEAAGFDDVKVVKDTLLRQVRLWVLR